MFDIRENTNRRLVTPIASLLIAAVIYLATGKVDMDPVNRSYRNRGSGIYICGFKIWDPAPKADKKSSHDKTKTRH